MNENQASEDTVERKWQALGSMERRVLGVLVEKAKTTPDNYPLSLNALTNGCNQKSNRDPQMSLASHQVEESLEKLRRLNAVAEVQGDGRVAKYRHYAYDWFGVDKFELAVLTELLLRGAQTLGELRGRAARMDPIADQAALKPIVESLMAKNLVISLTPPGRGQIVTHNLYTPEQLKKVQDSVGAGVGVQSSAPAAPSVGSAPSPAPAASASSSSSEVQELRAELNQLKAEVAKMKSDIEDLWSNVTG